MKIGICIVHFGAQELLDNCLKSLNVQPHSLQDDGFFLDVPFDCNKDNIGFTAANNKLILQYLSLQDINFKRFDWIWLLNNDTTVPSSTLQAIEVNLKGLRREVGVVGFQIRSMDEPDFIHHGGTGQCFPAGVHKTGSVKLKQLNKTTPEKWVTFASVLIRREVFEKIGLLDENMKFIGSDSDFCFRARAAGFKIIYEPSFVIYHKIGQSQKADNDPILKQMKQDMIYFQGKWLNGKLYFDLERELL